MKASLCLLFPLCFLAVEFDARAWQFYTKNGNPVHWQASQCEVTYYIDSAGIDGFEDQTEFDTVREALDQWSDISCSPFSFYFAGYRTDPSAQAVPGSEENDIIFVDTNWSRQPNYIALTTLSYEPDTGLIKDADMEINLDHFTFALCTDGTPELADFYYTVLHEAGHFTGLAHSEDNLSVMSTKEPFCQDSPPHFLTPDDLEGFCSLYGEPDYVQDCLTKIPDPMPEEEGDIVAPSDSTDAGGVEPDNPDIQNPDCGKGNGCSLASGPGRHAWLSLLLLALVLSILTIRAWQARS